MNSTKILDLEIADVDKDDLKKVLFQFYKGEIKSTKPVNSLSLLNFLIGIKNPAKHITELLQKIHEASLNKDEDLRNELKKNLSSFTPAVIVKNYRRYDEIERFTGLMPLDFDKLPSVEYSEDFRDYLIQAYPFIIASWLSSSKLGVRALARIPIATSTVEYKERFSAIENILNDYRGFDHAPFNCVLPLFYSADPNIRRNNNAIVFNGRYAKPKPKPQPYREVHSTDLDRKRVEAITKSGVDKINDNGHPQLVRISTSLGGFVRAGYLSIPEAETLIENLIDSNIYLSVRGKINGYKKTAREMITKAQTLNAIYLK